MKRLLVMARRFSALVLVGTLFVGLAPAPVAHAATSPYLRQSLEKKVNVARTLRGLRPLRASTYVCPAAMLNKACMQAFAANHAVQMARAGDIFHDTTYRLWREVPVIAWWRAENVGWVSKRYVNGTYTSDGTAADMHLAFMRSSGHRANILNPRATHLGFGVYQTPRRVYFVQRFTDVYPLP